MSSLQKILQSKGLPPLPQQPTHATIKKGGRKDYSVKPWTDYFAEKKHIAIGGNTFQYYQIETNPIDVLLVFLHGGGFSGLSWALLSKCLTSLINCRCMALDLRGHGGTCSENDSDMSAETLARDVCDVLDKLEADCPVVFIGHSMGGAIAVHACKTNRLRRLAALIVIDVVEGTALEALKNMRHVLQNRPRYFDSLEKANEWCVRSGYIRNLESARVSMVGQLVRKEMKTEQISTVNNTTPIAEEGTEELKVATAQQNNSCKYTWRIDLSQTEPYWEGWFKGMSSLFLSVPVPKILLLAGVDRLDKDLSIGQMQGKFQLEVVNRSGHAVHEDTPDQVANIIANFLTRHKLAKKR